MGPRAAALRADVRAIYDEAALDVASYAQQRAAQSSAEWPSIFGEDWWLDAVTDGN